MVSFYSIHVMKNPIVSIQNTIINNESDLLVLSLLISLSLDPFAPFTPFYILPKCVYILAIREIDKLQKCLVWWNSWVNKEQSFTIKLVFDLSTFPLIFNKYIFTVHSVKFDIDESPRKWDHQRCVSQKWFCFLINCYFLLNSIFFIGYILMILSFPKVFKLIGLNF